MQECDWRMTTTTITKNTHKFNSLGSQDAISATANSFGDKSNLLLRLTFSSSNSFIKKAKAFDLEMQQERQAEALAPDGEVSPLGMTDRILGVGSGMQRESLQAGASTTNGPDGRLSPPGMANQDLMESVETDDPFVDGSSHAAGDLPITRSSAEPSPSRESSVMSSSSASKKRYTIDDVEFLTNNSPVDGPRTTIVHSSAKNMAPSMLVLRDKPPVILPPPKPRRSVGLQSGIPDIIL